MDVPFEVHAAIHKQKARYGRYVDTKQWDKFDAIAFPDAGFTSHAKDGKVVTRDGVLMGFPTVQAFTTHFATVLRHAETLHMFGPGDLTFVSDSRDEVNAIWAMEDQFVKRTDKGEVQSEVRGGGYYHETYKLDRGVWKIKSLKLVRTYYKVQIMDQPVVYRTD